MQHGMILADNISDESEPVDHVDLLKDVVDKYRMKLKSAVEDRVRVHNEQFLAQLIGMFRC